MRVEQQPAFVLHTRPFRDSSLLVDLLSEDYGRLTLVAKGARQSKRGWRQLLQPFIPLDVSWQGNGELKTLTAADAAGEAVLLQGHYLYSGFYANELLTYLLKPYDAAPDLFQLYQQLLYILQQKPDLEQCLRGFELSLLTELGYGIDFSVDTATTEPIRANQSYGFSPNTGFINQEAYPDAGRYFAGEHIIAIGQNQLEGSAIKQAAKQITRIALAFYLQGKTIKSRELFKTQK